MDKSIRIFLTAAAITLVLPFVDQTISHQFESTLGFSAFAAEEKKKRKTRRVPSMSEQVYKKLAEAQEFVDAKDYNGAQNVLQSMLDRSKKYNGNEIGSIHNMLGYVYFLKEDYNNAIAQYKIVVDQGEDISEGMEVQTLYTLAQLSAVQEKFTDALRYMETWITKAENPGAPPRFFMGLVYYQMKDFNNAVKQMELGISISKERGTKITEQNWNLLNYLYHEKEDWPKSMQTLEVLVKQFPKRQYWVQLAALYGQEGDEKKQLHTLQAAYAAGYLEKQSDFTNLAGLLMQEEVPYKAAKVMVDGIEREAIERNAQNLRSLGQAWQLAQEVDKAIPVLQDAAKLADDGRIYERLAYLFMESDEYGKCVGAADSALDKGGLRKKQNVFIVKGMCQYNQDKLTSARNAFVSCRNTARTDEDTTNQRICNQWITHIDNEVQRLATLAAAG